MLVFESGLASYRPPPFDFQRVGKDVDFNDHRPAGRRLSLIFKYWDGGNPARASVDLNTYATCSPSSATHRAKRQCAPVKFRKRFEGHPAGVIHEHFANRHSSGGDVQVRQLRPEPFTLPKVGRDLQFEQCPMQRPPR
jgi:hypothetical protein